MIGSPVPITTPQAKGLAPEEVCWIQTDQGDKWLVEGDFHWLARTVGKVEQGLLVLNEMDEATEYVPEVPSPEGWPYPRALAYIKHLGYYLPTGRKVGIVVAHVVSVTRLAPRLSV